MSRRFYFFLVTWFFSHAALADFSALFQGDRVVFSSTLQQTEYQLSLESLKKINSNWISERDERVVGKIQRKTIEVSSLLSIDEIWAKLNDTVSPDYDRLYSCEGLDCGSSNAWANNRFGIKQLYGLDRTQKYGVWRSFGTEGDNYWVVYLVQRGNKRIYVQLDYIATQERRDLAPSAESIEAQLKLNGFYIIQKFELKSSGLTLNKQLQDNLIRALRRFRNSRFSIVGHDFSFANEKSTNNEGTTNMEKSLLYAQSLEALLKKYGVSSEFSAHGVGALAPEGKLSSRALVIIKNVP